MSSVCQCLVGQPFLLVTLREGKPLVLLVACANVYSGCIFKYITMARRDFFRSVIPVKPRIWPRRRGSWRSTDSVDVSEWLVCLNDVSLFVCVVTFTAMKLMANSEQKLCLSATHSPNSWTLFALSLSPVCMFPDFLLWQPSSIVILLTSNSLQTPLHSIPKQS